MGRVDLFEKTHLKDGEWVNQAIEDAYIIIFYYL